MLAPYRRILATPHLPMLLGVSLLARLYATGMALAVTFLVAGWTGSYTAAGVATAALVLGSGIGGPLRGRAVDRKPAPRILLLTAVGYATAVGLMAALPAAWWPVAPVLGLLAGLSQPPANQVARSLWSRLPDPTAREASYAVEATLQEVLFVVGPMLAAILVATVSPRAAVASCAALALLGTGAFALVVRRSGLASQAPAAQTAPRRGSPFGVLAAPGMVMLLAMMALLVGALAAGDMLLVAWAKENGTPSLAGVLGAVWAVGSGLGGLFIAGRTHRLPLRVALVAIGFVLLVPVLPPVYGHPSPWLIGAVLALGGTTIAPAIAASNSRLGALAPDDRRGEAFGWMTTACTAGGAVTSPVIGALLDHLGPAAGAGFAAIMIVAAAVLARLVPERRAAVVATAAAAAVR
ncbi:MAG TPA: MFS transporter [Actinocatenispora sp.]